MIEYLLDRSLRELRTPYSNILNVDPACGGGNFLVHYIRKVVSMHSNIDRTTLIEELLAGGVMGYELDAELAAIAALNIVLVVVALLGTFPEHSPQIYAGKLVNPEGFLKKNPVSERLQRTNRKILLATNPPFLGNRDMDPALRRFLHKKFPASRADLCAAFILHALSHIRTPDIAAFVHQNNWIRQVNFSAFRKEIFQEHSIVELIEIGPRGFPDLGGEKVQAALTLFSKDTTRYTKSTFVALITLSGSELRNAVRDNPQGSRFTLRRAELTKMLEGGICYSSSTSLRTHCTRLTKYGDYATPYQGTSTGDNRTYVAYHWTPKCNQEDAHRWKLASKGGGYARWAGLCRWKVYWGEKAEVLPHATLRNISKFPSTTLVYSDATTQGLSVRILEPGQIPMAGGPGIIVHKGNSLAHMAWLNARFSSFWLRLINQKITVSASYLKKIPFPETAQADTILIQAARRTLQLKKDVLRHFAGELLFSPPKIEGSFQRAALNFLTVYIRKEKERMLLEARMNQRVYELLQLSPAQIQEIHHHLGYAPARTTPKTMYTVQQLDRLYAGLLDDAVRFSSQRVGLLGSDNSFEVVAYRLGLCAENLYQKIQGQENRLTETMDKVVKHFMHMTVLKTVLHQSAASYSELSSLLSASSTTPRTALESWLRKELPMIHKKVYYHTPILRFASKKIHI